MNVNINNKQKEKNKNYNNYILNIKLLLSKSSFERSWNRLAIFFCSLLTSNHFCFCCHKLQNQFLKTFDCSNVKIRLSIQREISISSISGKFQNSGKFEINVSKDVNQISINHVIIGEICKKDNNDREILGDFIFPLISSYCSIN